jgi:hypothetical protein
LGMSQEKMNLFIIEFIHKNSLPSPGQAVAI